MGHVRRGGENGAGGDREEKRGSRELGGAERGLDRSRMAAAVPAHPLPGASSPLPPSRGENAQGKYF